MLSLPPDGRAPGRAPLPTGDIGKRGNDCEGRPTGNGGGSLEPWPADLGSARGIIPIAADTAPARPRPGPTRSGTYGPLASGIGGAVASGSRYPHKVDDIAFAIERDFVVAIVNGVDLREMFGRTGLIGFSPRMLPPSGELFGEQRERAEDGGPMPDALPVLVCGCGEAGCGSVTVRVSTEKDQIVWSDFSDYFPENGAVPMSFGPFRFDRSGYSQAIGAAARAWRREGRHVRERRG